MAIEKQVSNATIGKQRILSADISEFNKDFLESLFAAYYDKETNQAKQAPFNPTDKITLSHNEYQYVKDSVETTLGLLFMNRFLLEYTGVIQFLGYWNRTLDKKGLGALNVAVNNLIITDQIDTYTNAKFVDRRDQLGFQSTAFLSTSISAGLIRPMHNVNQRKLELMEQYHDEIYSQDPTKQILAMNKIEKELMEMVRQNLKDDTGYDMYASGDGNLDNNYKTINVMRGAVFNNITGRFDIVDSSLMDGVKKKDIPAFANSIVAGAYPSAVGTADSGYMAKIILALLQSEHIDADPNSDCGTTKTIPITITDKNKQYVLYRYINDGGQKVLTTLENIGSYVGKTVELYSPQCCIHESICGKCGGRVFHNLGVQNVGLLVTSITQALLNKKLKSKHDLSQKASIIDKKYIFNDANSYYDIHDGFIVPKTIMKVFVPKLFEEFSGFSIEATVCESFGVLPVKFYKEDGSVILSALMTIPATLRFNIYDDIQEDPEYYIIQYDAGDQVCSVAMQQSVANVEFYINQIYLHSKSPQLPYNLMTELMFRCLELNGIDLNGPSITYEMLARRVCRHGNKSFASMYGKSDVDPMSYDKEPFRVAVQRAGILQGLLFQDISTAITVGLSHTIRGIPPTQTPLEKVIKA